MAGLATGLAIAGLAISAGTTATSFIQAGKQKRLQEGYEADADKALAEARRALQVNYAKQMSIKKEPYNQERLAMLSQGQQLVDAASDSDRGAASAAGQVLMGQQASQADITNRQSDELINIENAILEEESRLRDVNVDLDMQEIEGAQQAAADARIAAADATQAGIQGIGQTAQAGLAMVPLFQQNLQAQKAALSGMSLDPSEFQNFGNVLGKDGGASKSMGAAGSDGFTNLDFDAIGAMSNSQYRQFMGELTPKQKQMLYHNKQYTDNYTNPFNLLVK